MAGTPIPTTPIERDPIEVYHGLSLQTVAALIDQAVDGIQLGAYDIRILEWIKGLDQPTIVTIASLIARSRQQPTTEQEHR